MPFNPGRCRRRRLESGGIDGGIVVIAVIGDDAAGIYRIIAVSVIVRTDYFLIDLAVAIIVKAVANLGGTGIDVRIIIVAVVSTPAQEPIEVKLSKSRSKSH